ncbi:MAG: M23 family metallopeptidase [Solirubrobacteraceae bacterium]
MSPRTLKIQSPHMTGDDAAAWERALNQKLDDWKIKHRIKVDGDYSIDDRSMTASILYGLGIGPSAMERGITPELRIKVRNSRLTAAERARYDQRADWRRRLRERLDGKPTKVHRLLQKVITDDWGYHPPVHDGVDLICAPNATLYAPCRARVIDVRSGGWWGKGAPSPAVAAKGDGIIQLEILDTVGPLKKGHHLGYGHAEHARVKVGQTVDPGDPIGKAGLANAWHVHFMANRGEIGNRGVGTYDPRPIIDYCQRNG